MGAPGRMNYTVIGDTVNVAQRLEQLAKQHLDTADEVVVLASGATIGNPDVGMKSLGRHTLRGRREEIEIYRLA